MEGNKIKVGITHGDINGVGYEVILKTFSDPLMLELCTPVVYGSPKVAAYHRKAMDISTNFSIVNSASEAQEGRLSVVNCTEDELKVELSKPTQEGGSSSHTEYIEREIGKNRKALTMMLKGDLRIALVTGHIPVGEITETLSKELIMEKIDIFNRSLKKDFGIGSPRIAVFALNPHAGNNGLAGSEEEQIIIPAIEAMMQRGVLCYGPYPADSFMGSGNYRHFDGILAMYHDQGAVPFKALAMNDGIVYTAGLPIVRTSPAHGTAYDIAGKGIASEDSFRQAVYAAIDIFRHRRMEEEISAHPLRKQYYEKRDDSDKLKLDSTDEE